MMKRVLILYATTEGQTRKIVTFVADKLRDKGLDVRLLDGADADPDTELPPFDVALVAASVHAGGFQKSVARLVSVNAARLAAVPNAFLSVSLSAAGDDPDDWRGLQKCLEDFFEDADWRPQRVEHVAGAFRYTKYDFFKRWVMKSIAKQKGAPIDTSRDWEFTNWDKLAAFADGFAAPLTT